MFVPFRTDRPRIRPAYLTVALIVINTLVQVGSRLAGSGLATVRLEGLPVQVQMPVLVRDYGLWGNHPTLLTFFTHQFIHADELHLIGNMLFLWIFGSLIEDVIRPWGLAALYLGGGFLAAFAHIGISSLRGANVAVPLVGASGAIAAIMGLFALRFYKTRVQIFYGACTFWCQSVWALGAWIGLEVLEGVFSNGQGVAHWAHVGGFLAGVAAAPFLGSVAAAREEYFSDDPHTNVEYVRRNEVVAAAGRALKADPNNPYLMRKLATALRVAADYERATRIYEHCVHRFATLGDMEQAVEIYLELLDYNDSAVLPPDSQLKLCLQLEPTRLDLSVRGYQYLIAHSAPRPEGEYALFRLATILQHTYQQEEQALRCYDDFLYRYPSSQWAPQATEARATLKAALSA